MFLLLRMYCTIKDNLMYELALFYFSLSPGSGLTLVPAEINRKKNNPKMNVYRLLLSKVRLNEDV